LGCHYDRRHSQRQFPCFFWRRDRFQSIRAYSIGGTSLFWGAGYALFLKAIEYRHTAVELRAADGFSAVCLTPYSCSMALTRPAAMILAALTISTTFLFAVPAVKCQSDERSLIATSLSREVAPK